MIHHCKSSTLVKKSTPGNYIPSNNSKLAPPPVETWLILSPAPLTPLTRLTVSPPPTIVMAPPLVTSMTLSKIQVDPNLNFPTSKSPYGPFQIIVLALLTASQFKIFVSGPESRPAQPSGIPLFKSKVFTSELSSNLFPHTKSTGSVIFTPLSFALANNFSTIS